MHSTRRPLAFVFAVHSQIAFRTFVIAESQYYMHMTQVVFPVLLLIEPGGAFAACMITSFDASGRAVENTRRVHVVVCVYVVHVHKPTSVAVLLLRRWLLLQWHGWCCYMCGCCRSHCVMLLLALLLLLLLHRCNQFVTLAPTTTTTMEEPLLQTASQQRSRRPSHGVTVSTKLAYAFCT